MEASRHSTNEGLLFDGLKGTDPPFTCQKDGQAKSCLRDIFDASTGPPLGCQMGDALAQELDEVGQKGL